MEDRELARRMRAGDQRAFEAFFDGHFPAVYRFALARVGHDPDAAEEVAQAALCKAVAKIHTYRGEAALLTWLCTFCRHEIAAHHARLARHPVVDLPEDRWEVAAALDSLGIQGPEQSMERREVGRLVHLALDRLPPRYADALEWKYVDGLTVEAIAGRMETSAKAVESLLTRAREAFRDAFATLHAERPTP
jgi:RNA polymerase sigma-70 factor (ECF subfamily)